MNRTLEHRHIIIQLSAYRILIFRADLAAHLGAEFAVGLNADFASSSVDAGVSPTRPHIIIQHLLIGGILEFGVDLAC